MLRVRDVPAPVSARPHAPAAILAKRPSARAARLAAFSLSGLALGIGGVLVTVSLVQAEDDAGIRAFHRAEYANRHAEREPARVAYASTSAYAPARGPWTLPLFQTHADGRIAHPKVDLNPFRTQDGAKPRPAQTKPVKLARLDPVSGAASTARTICVRMCDGFHAPLGYLRANADIKAHEALCSAANPGIPVKVFRVAAGAATIDAAVSADGKSVYGKLPVAYGHEKSSDAACRPAIVAAGEHRVSLLRDFTLRRGDSVVLDGKVKTFAGAKWPYQPRDFVDFRSSRDLTAEQRRQIDVAVGISRAEAQMRLVRRQLRLQQAGLQDDDPVEEALILRGPVGVETRGPVRVVAQSPFIETR